MTVTEFCQSRNLQRSTLYRALKYLRNEDAGGRRGTRLLEVKVAGVTRGGKSGGKELAVVLGDGRRIEVPYGFDMVTLQRLMSALERS